MCNKESVSLKVLALGIYGASHAPPSLTFTLGIFRGMAISLRRHHMESLTKSQCVLRNIEHLLNLWSVITCKHVQRALMLFLCLSVGLPDLKLQYLRIRYTKVAMYFALLQAEK
jgi:hypothetical protein